MIFNGIDNNKLFNINNMLKFNNYLKNKFTNNHTKYYNKAKSYLSINGDGNNNKTLKSRNPEFFSQLGFVVTNIQTTNLHQDLANIRQIICNYSIMNNLKYSIEKNVFIDYLIVISPSQRGIDILSMSVIPTTCAADVIRHNKLAAFHNISNNINILNLKFEELIYNDMFNRAVEKLNFYIIMTDVAYYFDAITSLITLSQKIDCDNYLIGSMNMNLFLSEGYICLTDKVKDSTYSLGKQNIDYLGSINVLKCYEDKNIIRMDVLGNYTPYIHTNTFDILNILDQLVIDCGDYNLVFKVDYQIVYSTARYASISIIKTTSNNYGILANKNVIYNKYNCCDVKIIDTSNENSLYFNYEIDDNEFRLIVTASQLNTLDAKLLKCYEGNKVMEKPSNMSDYVSIFNSFVTKEEIKTALSMSDIRLFGNESIQFCKDRLYYYLNEDNC